MSDFQTIEITDLQHVQGGNGLVRLGVRGAQAAWGGMKAGARFVRNAFKPATPLDNAKNISDYAGQVGKTIGTGAAVAEGASRATTGESLFGGK